MYIFANSNILIPIIVDKQVTETKHVYARENEISRLLGDYERVLFKFICS